MVGLVLSVATVGCVKSDGTSANQSGMVTLQLSNGTLTTRAVAPGPNDDTNNEDLIVDAQVFFFGSNADNATVQYSYYTDITDVNETASISIPLTTEQLTSLFPGGNGYVYVIANYGSEITGATTLAALKATAIGSTFGADANGGVQPSFVMDSDLTTVARGTANTITGEVFLTRAAAKVELTVNVAPITQDGKQWIADTANMRLSFNNGVSNGFIDDGSDEGAEPASDGTTFDIADRGFTLVTGAAGSGTFTQSVPFYSYSTKWTAGAENEVYLQLAIPWAVNTEGDTDPTYQTFYYQVPVSADALTLVRNAYYKLTLDVGVLGGLTEPVTVEPSYVVLNWGTNDVNVTLSRPKYLVVDKNRVVLNNLESIGVGYQSSDAVTVTILSSTIDGTNADEAYAVYGDYSVSPSGGEIVFNHQLDNTRSSSDKTYDYLPQTVVVRVAHTTDSDIYEDITFIQYPAMYVEAEFMARNTVIVNGNTSATGGWWWVAGDHSNSQNIYAVTVSAFDESTADYIIADPREPSNNNNFVFRQDINANSQVRATAEDASGDNTLTGYRATITGPASVNLVAPAFIVASSWITNGGNSVNSYDYNTNGKYRCAGYQENGYPAGRWRLPTPAEIQVIARLCTEGKIDNVFYAGGSRYLSSNGAYTVSPNNGGTVEYYGERSSTLRCVYDIWYWKDKCADPSQFIWGAEGDIANGAKSDYLVPVE